MLGCPWRRRGNKNRGRQGDEGSVYMGSYTGVRRSIGIAERLQILERAGRRFRGG